ncbi:putative beta lactamase-related protein [Calothrix parasitica NIES-267]|uniref:Putative beta lactamase-related protein n=1 Tax=Calothrix parasitica NIES-267 TaxID=1973488 RepID=A0A1Z4LRP8_9CYAN|nr:putative beta lactamase-related protein [Calothrix parasitica NIES-267]
MDFKQILTSLFLIKLLIIPWLIFHNYASAVLIKNIYLAQVNNSVKSMTPEAVLEKLFTSEDVKAEWFASTFLAAVPITQIEIIVSGTKNQLGSYEGVEQESNDYIVNFSQGSVATQIALNSDGQIVGLLLKPSLNINSLSDAIAEFEKLPGKVSFIVKEDSTIIADFNGKTTLAVGSAFKLAILKTLKQQIASGQKSWSDTVTLKNEDKSLPSGILQTWPENSQLTLQTLATLMISMSDNTATDILIKQIGRESIESISSNQNIPFITTRELYSLKASQNSKLLQRYRKGDVKQRREILAEIANQPLPDINDFITNPNALDIEWFYNAEELCELIEAVADLPLMSINPGIANPKDWERVAFKGGSEPGVINITTWLKGKNNKQYCVVATWNNSKAPVDEGKFATFYGGIISFLANNLSN